MMPGAGTERERLLAAALADYADCRARGETFDVDGFCREHPEVAAELRSDISTLTEFEGDLAEPAPTPVPERLSGCRVLGEIGAGGMGRVLLAEDEALGRKVAIKTLSPRLASVPALRARFMHEARAMARLTHPWIARVYRLGPTDEPPHFVMEYVDGAPLTEAARPLTWRQKAELMRKAAVAVEFLHQHHVIHRDLKPGNILVGADLEPKLLDFGLARETTSDAKLTRAGEVLGTPDYFSPEQARTESHVGAASDVFSLGVILYEVLTGVLPFRAVTLHEQVRKICQEDPVLPRRIDPKIPGELQNVCMKALEKRIADRYASAREFAADLERFLAGEPVLAAPSSYSRLMSGRIERHLAEIEGWRRDRVLSLGEWDLLRKAYGRLVEREDAWIMEARRLSLQQVSLYLGAWIIVIGAALLMLFQYKALHGPALVLVAAGATVPVGWIGMRCWNAEQKRIGMALLLAFCLMLPTALVIAMQQSGLMAEFTRGKETLELFSKFPAFTRTTNAQLWWALLVSLPAYYALRRLTGSSVFSLVLAIMAAQLCAVSLLRMGLLEWVETDPGRPYFALIPCAALFLTAAIVIEKLSYAADSRYFYPIAVAFTWISLSGVVVFHEPYANWLKAAAPWTRGQLEYLFILNAGVYFVLQAIFDRFTSEQLRTVAKAVRFVIPGHVMTSMLLLGIAATSRWKESPQDLSRRFEARVFEVLLPLVACGFVFGSIRKQMKNFFATGLLFLAIGVIRLQQNLFEGHAWWPVALLAAGLLLLLAAARYSRLRLLAGRWLGERR